MKIKYSILDFTPKDINEENSSLRAVFSTGDVDRHGEIVDQKSWILDEFMQNPVVLFGHDHSQPPVGKIIGLSYNAEGNLEGEVKFAAKEYPFANVIWNLYKGGFMKAFSVGFSAGNADIVNDQVILRNNTLYEISTVSVPANAMALAKSKGIDTAPLEQKIVEMKEEKEKEEVPSPSKAEEPSPSPAAAAEETEKGAVADQVEVEESWKLKYENMNPAWDIMCALSTVYMDEDTPVEAFGELAGEAGSLMSALGTAPESPLYTDALKNAIAAGLSNEDGKELMKVLSEKFEKAAPKEEVTLAKGLQALATSLKEGKVLSKKNRTAIEEALKALQAVLDADKKEQEVQEEEGKGINPDKLKELKTISVNKTGSISIKVETPSVRMTIPAHGRGKATLINKAVRRLLAEKTKNK